MCHLPVKPQFAISETEFEIEIVIQNLVFPVKPQFAITQDMSSSQTISCVNSNYGLVFLPPVDDSSFSKCYCLNKG